MKTILYILIIALLPACTPNQEEERLTDKEILPSMDSSLIVGDYRFISEKEDSSYIDYWCSTGILGRTSANLENLDLVLVADFLATFNSQCGNNIEYSQWANDLLFKVSLRKPELVHQLLSKNSSLDREEIVKHLESPIQDGINLDAILKEFQNLSPLKLKDSELWKAKMIQGIVTAKEKNT